MVNESFPDASRDQVDSALRYAEAAFPVYRKLAGERRACFLEAIAAGLERNDEEIIDARTSDAIALALRFNAPIFTYKTILDKAGIFLKFSSKEKEEDEDDSIMVDEILQEGEAVELESGSDTHGYREMSLQELHKELDNAVASEDYEKAAKLRDEISKRK